MMPSDMTFRKTLSLNDTGETGGHMGGILIPKTQISFFPPLDKKVKNPRQHLTMIDREGKAWKLTYIYYNSSSFDGTRREFRLTGLTAFIKSNNLINGDGITIYKTDNESYKIDFELAEETRPLRASEQPLLDLTEQHSEKKTKISHDHSMRPAARIIHTIGENLIKDPEAAVMELVKNSYDADATNVHVQFKLSRNASDRLELRITVKDDGHGMPYEQVINSWLVPATTNKVEKRTSPNGRYLQGNKGIGRFAAFMLGSEVYMDTSSTNSPLETSLLLQASDFRDAEFLDQVRIIVDTCEKKQSDRDGMLLEMTSYENDGNFKIWVKADFEKLRSDLRRMLFPFRSRDDQFHVFINYVGFEDFGQIDGIEEVEPLPLLDYFDYRIKVKISPDGKVEGKFTSPLLLGSSEENILFKLPNLAGEPCGEISADIRVVDREPAALQDLLDRAADTLEGTGRAQLKRLLNEACGVSVYRGDFRMKPYGDKGNDWLELDRKRVNNPSECIGNNQSYGIISIEPEEISHLEEKSARDGLREDEHYERLCDVISKIIIEIQRRRYEIRRKVGRINKATPVAKMLEKLTDFEKPFDRINHLLKSEGIDDSKVDRIRDILKEDSESRQGIISQLENAIATYQGQATLGKTVGKLLHEGNRSLGILRNQGRRILPWLSDLLSTPSKEVVNEVTIGLNGISSASDTLIDLFNSIEPLGVRSRGPMKEFPLAKPIRTVVNALNPELIRQGIKLDINVPDDFKITGWEQDLNAIFFNLIDNSKYWLIEAGTETPIITLNLEQDTNGTILEISDNGPGIPIEHITSEAIFEPTFSLKGGFGLGLPIAGECASRNKFQLRAAESSSGAHFILDFTP